MAVPSGRSAACTAAALAVLADGAIWSTSALEEATGYGVRYGQLLYRMLERLHKLGRLDKYIDRSSCRPVHWRWLPAEGDCDEPRALVLAECRPDWCRRQQGRGCRDCQLWARRNLGGRR
jgi:hypothetical protein